MCGINTFPICVRTCDEVYLHPDAVCMEKGCDKESFVFLNILSSRKRWRTWRIRAAQLMLSILISSKSLAAFTAVFLATMKSNVSVILKYTLRNHSCPKLKASWFSHCYFSYLPTIHQMLSKHWCNSVLITIKSVTRWVSESFHDVVAWVKVCWNRKYVDVNHIRAMTIRCTSCARWRWNC